MTTYLGKRCLPRVPFLNCRKFMYLVISLFGFEGRIWDLIVSVPDHCLSFYFTCHTDSKRTIYTFEIASSIRTGYAFLYCTAAVRISDRQ